MSFQAAFAKWEGVFQYPITNVDPNVCVLQLPVLWMEEINSTATSTSFYCDEHLEAR